MTFRCLFQIQMKKYLGGKVIHQIGIIHIQMLLELKRIQEAIVCCDITLYLNCKNDMAYTYKGFALLKEIYFKSNIQRLNKYKEAIDCYDKSISLNPKNDMVYQNKGFALLKDLVFNLIQSIQINIKRLQNAVIKLFNQILIMTWRIKTKVLHYQRIELIFYNIYSLNKYKEAIECCDKAISLNPNNHMAYNNKAFALLLQNSSHLYIK